MKRVIGVPGDHIRLVNKQVFRNGVSLNEPYVYHKSRYSDSYRDNFPSDPNVTPDRQPRDMLQNHVVNGEVVFPPDQYFAMGDNRDNSARQPLLGLCAARKHYRQTIDGVLVLPTDTQSLAGSSPGTLMHHFGDLAEHFFTKTRWRRTLMLIHGYHSDN